MRRFWWSLVGLTLTAGSLPAQGLRDKIGQLFIFADGQDPLFLGGTAGSDSATALHADHFVPSAVSDNGTLISFIGTAISQNVANLPVSATSGGSTFRFEGGVPVSTSASPGPVFAERALTLGRGRVFVGANINHLHFETLRGVSLSDIQMTFTHENVTGPACDSIVGASCTPFGVPTHENDVINLRLALDISMTVTSFFMSFGLLDRVDVGVVLPVVSTTLRGTSDAQIAPFGGTTAQHFFGGTAANPVLSTSRFVEGSATGIGDIAARVKINVTRSERTNFSLLADARFPTGSEEDLLGSGHVAARGLGILSARFATFSPHANVGFLFRGGNLQNNAVLATVGFDHLMAPWATIAVDLVSELQVGESKLRLPGPVTYDLPFRRTIDVTNIPNQRDDLIDGSFGFKFTTRAGITLVANTLFPLNRGGLRPNVLWTTGLEYNF
ncbi:MAG TPA: transporter [Gemmatimonadales bacterium]|nr:transporter [Gemmatimonadales bacterium]